MRLAQERTVMRVIDRNHIIKVLDVEKAYEMQKRGFVAFSHGKLIQPPVAHLELTEGSLHIKYGMIKEDESFVVKHATGFYNNWQKGLAPGDGFLAVFCAKTGMLQAILLDEGYLTNLRTALAARVCTEVLACKNIERVGVVGTGVQARMAVKQQALVSGCHNISVWGRSRRGIASYQEDMEKAGFKIHVEADPCTLLETSDLIITCTPAKKPLLKKIPHVKAKLIIALGADEKGKQELDSALLEVSSRIVVDQANQCARIGELQHAKIPEDKIHSLGQMINSEPTCYEGLTIVDLTGIAVQDIQIAKAVLMQL